MSTAPPLAAPPPLTPRVKRAIWGLGLTQIIGYGTSYYLLGLLGPLMLEELGLTKAVLLSGISLALLGTAFLGPAIGRWQDQVGSRNLMALGSVLMGLGLFVIARAQGTTLYFAGWILLAAGSPMCLYSASFTALAQMAGRSARRCIILVTLIGGLASTIVWPITAWMLTFWDWRMIVMVFGGLNILLCAPLHLLLLDAQPPGTRLLDETDRVLPGLPESQHGRAFVLMTTMLAVLSTVRDSWSMLAIPLLTGLGYDFKSAVLVASLVGLFQTFGRVGEFVSGGRHSPLRTAEISGFLFVLAVSFLMMFSGSLTAGILFAACYGIANGLNTLVKGTLTLAIFGSVGYGERLGKISFTPLIMAALGPIFGGFLLDRYGASGLLLFFLGGMVLGFFIMLMLTWHCRRYGLR